MKGPAPLIRTQARTKKTPEEERLSYLKSRHAAIEYGEVHTPESNPVSCGDTSTLELLCGPHGRAIPACDDTLMLELLCGPQGRAVPA
jgi:hypothetical protein